LGARECVLLVEDDDVEIMSVRRALRLMGRTQDLMTARDGLEALALLRGEDGASGKPLPYVILLDINMPRMNGLEFLRELRRDPERRDLPVVILTTSTAEADRQAACAAGVAGYIVKSTLLEDGFQAFAIAIDAYLSELQCP
jgi:CheY-like chemotaxis protein